MPETHPLCSLTTSGLEKFKELLADAPALSVDEVRDRISKICKNPALSKVEDSSVLVDSSRPLATRRDVAMYIGSLFKGKKIPAGPGEANEPMFSWLAMVLLPHICRRQRSGKLAVKGEERYILSRSSRDFYRHLIAFPYWIYVRFGDDAIMYLANKAYELPNVVEQFASRPWLINSRAVAQVLKRLYWDDKNKKPKDNYARELKHPRRPAPGTLLALEMTLSQLQCTYDLQSMTVDQLFQKLGKPSEFDAFLTGAASA